MIMNKFLDSRTPAAHKKEKCEVVAASEVMNDLGIELSDLNYLCSNASLACIGSLEMIVTADRRPIMIHRPACFAAGK